MAELKHSYKTREAIIVRETTDDESNLLLDLQDKNGISVFSVDKTGITSPVPPTAFQGIAVFNVISAPYNAVGNGVTDDTTAVQAAIDAASAVKGLVYFPPNKNFLCSTLNLNQDTRIWGYGSTITQTTGATTPLFYRAQGLATLSNIHIRGIKLVGAGQGLAETNRSGIWLTAVNDLKIEDCDISNFASSAIWSGGCRRVWIHRNKVYNCTTASGRNAIHIDGDFSDQGNVAKYGDVTITENYVENIVTGGIGATPQTSTQSARTNMIISNNIIRACGWSGIYCEAQWIRRVSIVGNQVFDCGDAIIASSPNLLFGASVEHVQFVSILGNVIDSENHSGGSNGRGIVFSGSNASIVANTIRASREAIYLDKTGGSTNGTGNAVQGNNITIANGSPAVTSSGIGANAQRELSVTGNTIRMEAGSGMGFGLYIQNSKYFKIANNSFYQLDEFGIQIGDGCTHGDVDNNLIVDVNAGNVSAHGIKVSDSGIDYISLRGNRIIDSGTANPAATGISVTTNPTNIVIESNHIVGLTSSLTITTAASIIRDRGNFRNNLVRNGGLSQTTPGAVATISIPHNLQNTPTVYSVIPANANARDAAVKFHVTATATNLVLTFSGNLTAATQYDYAWTAWV